MMCLIRTSGLLAALTAVLLAQPTPELLHPVGGVAIVNDNDLEPIRGGFRPDVSKVKRVRPETSEEAAIAG